MYANCEHFEQRIHHGLNSSIVTMSLGFKRSGPPFPWVVFCGMLISLIQHHIQRPRQEKTLSNSVNRKLLVSRLTGKVGTRPPR
jgi:hypothetical protein